MKSKILPILASFAIAFSLWLYVITVERTQIEDTFYNIPVIVDGAGVLKERGLMITGNTEMKVSLKLYGRRTDLNGLKSSDITVRLDVSRIYEEGEKTLSYEVEFPGSRSIEIMNRDPAVLTVNVEKLATKTVPIILDYKGTVPPAGYQVYSTELQHPDVTITGPERIINQIRQAKIEVDLSQQKDYLVDSFSYTLCDSLGAPIYDVSDVTTNRGKIRVSIRILKYKDVPLAYEVIGAGGLTAQDVSVTLRDPNGTELPFITVAGSTYEVDALDKILLKVDLNTVEDGKSFVLPITISESLINISGISNVYVTVNFRVDTAVATVEIPQSQFVYENLPKGLRVEPKTRFVSVTIRGRAEDMLNVRTEDITAVLDLTGAVPGIQEYPVQIRLPGNPRAGALGTYYINIEVGTAG